MSETPDPPGRLSQFQYFDTNPVWVKDLRQAARNWTVTGTLLLMMAVFYFIALGAMIFGETDSGASSYVGPGIYSAIGITTLIAAYIFIPIYVGIRTLMERISINADLQYITTMTPQQIIRGKILSSTYLIILFYSAAVPFLVFSYLLRGIDLPTILLSVVLTFLLNVLLTMGAIVLALSPLHIVMKILLALFVGGNAIFSAMWFVIGAVASNAITRLFGLGSFWNEAVPIMITFALDAILIAGLLYQTAVAFITPTSANRSKPLRIYFTLFCSAVVLQFYLWAWFTNEEDLFLPVIVIIPCLVILGFLFSIAGRDDLSLRVQREIPSNPFSRLVAFFFFNGTLSCLLWLLGLWIATAFSLLIFNVLWNEFQASSLMRDFDDIYLPYVVPSIFVLYCFAYALLGLWLHRTLLPKKSPKLASLFFVLLLLLPFLFLIIVYFVFAQDMIDEDWVIPGMVPNVFMVMNNYPEEERNLGLWVHFVSAIFMVGLTLLLNTKWIIQQVKQFKPLQRSADKPTVESDSEDDNILPPITHRG